MVDGHSVERDGASMRTWWLRFFSLILVCGMSASSAFAGPTATPTPVNMSISVVVTQSGGESRLLAPGKYRVSVKASAWSLCSTGFLDPRATPVPLTTTDTCTTSYPAARSYTAAYRVYGSITGLTYFNTGGPVAGRAAYPVNDCYGNPLSASWPYTGPDGRPWVDRESALRFSTTLWAEFTVPGPSAALVGFTAGDCANGPGFYDNSGSLTLEVRTIDATNPTPTPLPTYTPTVTPLPTACSSDSLLPKSDIDKDGVLECNDQCEGDAKKTKYGNCGCGYVETQVKAEGTLPPGLTPRPCENPVSTTLSICDVRMTGVSKFDRKIARLRWKVFPNLQGPDNRVVCEVSRINKKRNAAVARWSYKNGGTGSYLTVQASNPRIPPFPTPYVAVPPPPAPFYYPFPTPKIASFDLNAKYRSTTAEGAKQRRLFSKLRYVKKRDSDEYRIRCLMTNLSATNPENNKSTVWKTVGGIHGNFVGETCPILLGRPSVPTVVPVPTWTSTPLPTATTPPGPTAVPPYPPTPAPAWYTTGYGTCNTTYCQQTRGALCIDNSGATVAGGLCGPPPAVVQNYCEDVLCGSSKDAFSSYSESQSSIFIYGGRTGGSKCANVTILANTPKVSPPACRNYIQYNCDGAGWSSPIYAWTAATGTLGTSVNVGTVCNNCQFRVNADPATVFDPPCQPPVDWREPSYSYVPPTEVSPNCRGVYHEDLPSSPSPDFLDAYYQVCWN